MNAQDHGIGGNDSVQPSALGPVNNASTTKALVLAQEQEECLLVDEMDDKIVYVKVGGKGKLFSIHQNLLFTFAPDFEEHFNTVLNPADPIYFTEEHPEMFRLFANYLYTKQIPVVTATMSDLQKAARMRYLCMLLVFAEKYEFPRSFSNKIMDAIQDSFAMCGKLPDWGLIQNIFKNSREGSKLRCFVAHCVIFGLREVSFQGYDDFRQKLPESKDFMAELIVAIKSFVDGIDPRVRDCHGEATCAECDGAGAYIPKNGYWPCAFHLHNVVHKADASVGGTIVYQDSGCYLWHQ